MHVTSICILNSDQLEHIFPLFVIDGVLTKKKCFMFEAIVFLSVCLSVASASVVRN